VDPGKWKVGSAGCPAGKALNGLGASAVKINLSCEFVMGTVAVDVSPIKLDNNIKGTQIRIKDTVKEASNIIYQKLLR